MAAKKTVEEYLAKHEQWRGALQKFRLILLGSKLEETIKWGAPVYTLNGKNVVGMGAFKSYVGLWFFQGAFLSDEQKLLVNAQEGKTKALRQMRFSSENEIDEDLVRSYVLEAIYNQKAGKEIKPSVKKPLIIPSELQLALEGDQDLKTAFEGYTPGKQREFANHVSEAKQEATRLKRVEKIIPMIKSGIGLNDRYRKC